MKAKVSISRPHGGGTEGVRISIVDEKSNTQIVDVVLSLEDFAACLTGQGNMRGEVQRLVPSHYHYRLGRKKVIEHVSLEDRSYWGGNRDRLDLALSDMCVEHDKRDGIGEDEFGWEIHSTGNGTQQNGNNWQAVLCRYIEEE